MAEKQMLELDGVFLIRPRVFADERGYFLQTWSAGAYEQLGIPPGFVQDNESYSQARGTVRGLHFQSPPTSQAKLVRVVRGSIFDVAVDIRRSSPTYGRWCSAVLTASGAEQIYVPHGYAHGFCTLEDDVIVAYKVDGAYAPDLEGGIIWNDSDIGVDWPLPDSGAVVSRKDRELMAFQDYQSPFE